MNKHPDADCENCPLKDQPYVPTEANGNDLFIVGLAPGRHEARKKRPFVGPSGQLIDITLSNYGIDRNECTLTNVVACQLPYGTAEPPREAVRACEGRLSADLAPAQGDGGPILALGREAARVTLHGPEGKHAPLARVRVGPPKLSDWLPGARVIPTYHPAAALRVPDNYVFIETDVLKINSAYYTGWVNPNYIVYGDCEDTVTGACIALEQVKNNPDYDPITIDLEVGEEKDNSFGHPEKILSVGIAYSEQTSVVIGETGLRDPTVRELLAEVVRTKYTIYHNAKYDVQVFYKLGITHDRANYDTMLANYCLDERRGVHGLKYLAKEYLGAPDWDKELHNEGGFQDAPRDLLYKYNAYDAVATYRLYTLQQNDARWDANLKKLFDFLMEAQHVLMHIEIEGIKVDLDALDALDEQFSQDIEQKTYELQPEHFNVVNTWLDYLKTKNRPTVYNPNSQPQTLAILYALGIETKDTDKTTLKEALNEIRNHPKRDRFNIAEDFINTILDYRKVAKLHGTYVKGVRQRLHKGRMHTTFLLHGTTTGRTSSREANIQNVPREPSIRKTYIPENEHSFVQLDYKNIEGRVVFVLANSENGKKILEEGRDIHGEVAAQVYGPSYTKEQRTKAKSIVHGLNYGRTPHGIAADPDIGATLEEAEELFNSYKLLVPEVFEWQKHMEDVIFSNEDLITPFGRKRRFALVTDENRLDVYKEGLAFLPQSIASDITLSSVIELWKLDFKVRNFVHDSILLETPDTIVNATAEEAQGVMEDTAQQVFTDWISFPIEYDIGKSWGDV